MSHNRLHGRGFFSLGIMARAKSERKYKSDDCFLRCPVPGQGTASATVPRLTPRQRRVVARLSWKIRDSFQFFPIASLILTLVQYSEQNRTGVRQTELDKHTQPTSKRENEQFPQYILFLVQRASQRLLYIQRNLPRKLLFVIHHRARKSCFKF